MRIHLWSVMYYDGDGFPVEWFNDRQKAIAFKNKVHGSIMHHIFKHDEYDTVAWLLQL